MPLGLTVEKNERPTRRTTQRMCDVDDYIAEQRRCRSLALSRDTAKRTRDNMIKSCGDMRSSHGAIMVLDAERASVRDHQIRSSSPSPLRTSSASAGVCGCRDVARVCACVRMYFCRCFLVSVKAGSLCASTFCVAVHLFADVYVHAGGGFLGSEKLSCSQLHWKSCEILLYACDMTYT